MGLQTSQKLPKNHFYKQRFIKTSQHSKQVFTIQVQISVIFTRNVIFITLYIFNTGKYRPCYNNAHANHIYSKTRNAIINY
jgi:hypothetical protein